MIRVSLYVMMIFFIVFIFIGIEPALLLEMLPPSKKWAAHKYKSALLFEGCVCLYNNVRVILQIVENYLFPVDKTDWLPCLIGVNGGVFVLTSYIYLTSKPGFFQRGANSGTSFETSYKTGFSQLHSSQFFFHLWIQVWRGRLAAYRKEGKWVMYSWPV